MDSNQGSYPNALGLFNESVITTFRNVSDIMPSGREKYIHSVGAVAKFTFNPQVPLSQVSSGNSQVDCYACLLLKLLQATT